MFAMAYISFSIDDGGYMYGAGWRILQGQAIYQDFIYARPPVSPYLNALLQWVIPDQNEYLNIRRFFYLEVFTYSIISVYILKQEFKEMFKEVDPILVGTLFFICNVHFNNYMWHTTDGLFFLTISLWLIQVARKRFLVLFTSALFLVLAAGTKQSFYPALFMLPLFVFMYSGRESGKVFISSLVLILVFLFGLTQLIFSNEWNAWVDLKQNENQLKPLLEAGLIVYIVHGAILLLITSFFMLTPSNISKMKIFMKNKNSKESLDLYLKTTAKAIIFTTIGFLALYSFVDFIWPKMVHIMLSGGLLFSFGALTYLYLGNKDDQKKNQWLLMSVMVSIAWMSSLSWGYKTPIFYSGPILFFIMILSGYKFKKSKTISFVLAGLILIPLITSERELFIGGKNLSVISEKLNNVYMYGDKKISNMIEINEKVEMCQTEDYIVFPSHTYMDYAKKTSPSIEIDWVSNAEAMNRSDEINHKIINSNCLIIDNDYRFKNKRPKFGWDYNISGYNN